MRQNTPFKRSKKCDIPSLGATSSKPKPKNGHRNNGRIKPTLIIKELDDDEFEDDFEDEFEDEITEAYKRSGMVYDENAGEWDYNGDFQEGRY